MKAGGKEIPKAALIGEDFAGMHAQMMGIVNKLGCKWQFYPVTRHFSRFTSFFLRYLPVKIMAFFMKNHLPVLEKDIGMIISIGGFGGWMGALSAYYYDLPIIQIQNPRSFTSRYDLILACQHDAISRENILSLPTALHEVTDVFLTKNRLKWEEKLNPGKKSPFLGVLLGGNNGRYVFGKDTALELAEKISAFLAQKGGHAMIVPSRRTPKDVLEILAETLKNRPVTFWTGGADNPYAGLLACCDVLCVTGDSVSMLSEAAASRAAMGIFSLKGRSKKLEKFHHLLFSKGRAQAFSPDMKLGIFQPLDEGEKAVAEIRKRLHF